MKSIFRITLAVLISHLTLQINGQRYLEEVFPAVSVDDSIVFGVNATVINATVSGMADPENLLLDVYQPIGDTFASRPLIIYLHSGNFLPFPQNQTPSGTRSDFHLVDLCTRLAKRGYVVASCDYRLGWLPASPDQAIRNNTLINAIYRGMQDARTAARYFRKLAAEANNPYRIDSNRIIIAGEGAGAMIALTAATVDGAADFNIPKFIQNGTPIINEFINGNTDGTSWGINPLNGDTLCYVNHPGYTSDFNAAFNLSGALPDISWMSSIDPAIFSIHSNTDPFFPFLTDTMNVSVLNYPLFEVSGSGSIQATINSLGNDENFLILSDGCDDVSAAANSNNNGVIGLYPLLRPFDQQNDAFPWEWWSASNVNNSNGLVVNPDMSADKSALFQDTILAFLSPRLMCALNLEGNPCDAGLYGCMDPSACNYCDAAINDDGNCNYVGETCNDGNASTMGETWSIDCVCSTPIMGCTNSEACNYNSLAVIEDGSCAFAGDACNDNSNSTSSDTYDIDCNCVGIPINPSGCNPSDINWATQGYFVSPNPNAGETLAGGTTGIYYSDNIYLNVPTNVQGVIPNAPFPISITNITVSNISVTAQGSTITVPLSSIGLSYQCNSNGSSSSCTFLPNQPSCIEIFGVPTSTGVFTLTFNLNAVLAIGSQAYPLQVMTLTIGGAGCTEINACNYDANATIDNGSCFSQGDACSDNLNYTINDIINSDCICEGVCGIITPSVTYEPINCNGENTEVSFTYNGSNIPEAVVINGIDTLSNTIIQTTGVFSYYLIAEGGCVSATNTIEIIEPELLSVQLNADNVQCNGYSSGSAYAAASGGTAPYSYQWSNGTGISQINNVPAGNYSIQITDNNGCQTDGSITITEPPLSLGINVFIIYPTCGNNNGSINIQTENAVGNTTYNWQGFSNTNQINNIGAGIYSLVVSDDFCSIDTTIIINPSNGPVVSNFQTQNISCYGINDGWINLEISGGTVPVTVEWSDGNDSLIRTNLTAGNYIVTLTDALDCHYIQEFELTEPLEIVASLSIQNVDCFGDNNGSVGLNLTGGIPPYSIEWNGAIASSQLLYNDLSSGIYNYYIEDSQGCALTGQATVNGPSAPLEVIIQGDPIVCGDSLGNATAIATGVDQVSYLWSNGATTQILNDIPVGEYFVIASDGSCSDTAYFFLGNNLPLVQDSVRNVTCNGFNDGFATAMVAGGTAPYIYNWSVFPGTIPIANPTANEQNSLPPGNYYVSITESSPDGCTSGFSFTITEPLPINIQELNLTHISCHGFSDGSISIDIAGGTGAYTVLWSNGALENTIENIAAGTYTITVSDENGCSATNNFNVNEPPALMSLNTISDITCFDSDDGSVTINPIGGTSPYSISWNSVILTNNFIQNNLSAGDYTFSLTDAQSCVFSDTVSINGPLLPLQVNISGDAIICGDNFGVLETEVTGNETVVSYTWSKEGTGTLTDTLATILDATVGLYTVTIASNGCTATDQFFLGNNLPLLNVQSEDVTCFGGSDGYASASPDGGQQPYTYEWYSLNGSPSVSNPNDSLQDQLYAGTYAVTVTETSGCVASYEFTIAQPEEINIQAAVENANCNNAFEGNINIFITGGYGPYNILWENGSTASTLSNLPAADYEVYISDNNGCSHQESITVEENGVPIEVSFITTAPTCGNSDGSIDALVISANSEVTYVWNGNIGPANQVNLSAGTYAVAYSDGLCSGTTEITLATINGPQIDSSVVIPVSCYGGNDGQIQLYWSSSSASVTFSWSDLSNSQNLVNAFANTYSVLLTDENSCTYTSSFNIPQPDSMYITFTLENNNCYGDSAGQIDFNINGGTPPYTLTWNDISYNEPFNIAELAAENYPYQIFDSQGCIQQDTILIQQPEPIEITFTVENISCLDSFGTIIASVSGGIAPYNYVWNNGDTLNMIDNLNEGNYILQIQDINGCTFSDSSAISDGSSILDVTVEQTDPTCPGEFNGSILINEVVGGLAPYNYEWANNIGQGNYAGNLSAGEYSYTITDSAGCEYNSTVTLTDPTPLIGIITGPEIIETGDTAIYQFSISGGDYSWSSLSGNTIGSATSPDFYVTWSDSINDIIELTYTDNNGCEIYTTLNVSILPLNINESISSSLELYPNPVNSVFTVCTSAVLNGNPWSITDQTGRVCLEGIMSNSFKVNISHLSPGTYFFLTGSTATKFQVIR